MAGLREGGSQASRIETVQSKEKYVNNHVEVLMLSLLFHRGQDTKRIPCILTAVKLSQVLPINFDEYELRCGGITMHNKFLQLEQKVLK